MHLSHPCDRRRPRRLVGARSPDKLFALVTLLAATLPSVTVIMYVDRLVGPKLFGFELRTDRVPAWRETGGANSPALVAPAVAIAFDVYGNGILHTQDGVPKTDLGIVSLEAWALGGFIYVCLVALAARCSRTRLPGFPQGSEPPSATLELASDQSPAAETTR